MCGGALSKSLNPGSNDDSTDFGLDVSTTFGIGYGGGFTNKKCAPEDEWRVLDHKYLTYGGGFKFQRKRTGRCASSQLCKKGKDKNVKCVNCPIGEGMDRTSYKADRNLCKTDKHVEDTCNACLENYYSKDGKTCEKCPDNLVREGLCKFQRKRCASFQLCKKEKDKNVKCVNCPIGEGMDRTSYKADRNLCNTDKHVEDTCNACLENYYSEDGKTCEKCPDNLVREGLCRKSACRRRKCMCKANSYRKGNECVACPNGGEENDDNRPLFGKAPKECPVNSYETGRCNKDNDVRPTCTCIANYYRNGDKCEACPDKTTKKSSNDGIEACTCIANYYRNGDKCEACPDKTTKKSSNDGIEACTCIANYYRNGDKCEACPNGGEKKISSNDGKETCSVCEENYYSKDGKECRECPENSYRKGLCKKNEDVCRECTCKKDHYRDARGNCEACPNGGKRIQ